MFFDPEYTLEEIQSRPKALNLTLMTIKKSVIIFGIVYFFFTHCCVLYGKNGVGLVYFLDHTK
jgi:hypothetical protein